MILQKKKKKQKTTKKKKKKKKEEEAFISQRLGACLMNMNRSDEGQPVNRANPADT